MIAINDRTRVPERSEGIHDPETVRMIDNHRGRPDPLDVSNRGDDGERDPYVSTAPGKAAQHPVDCGAGGFQLLESRVHRSKELNIPVRLQEGVDVGETFGNPPSFHSTIADPYQRVAAFLHLAHQEISCGGETVPSKPTLDGRDGTLLTAMHRAKL